jgi:hypothetical protein
MSGVPVLMIASVRLSAQNQSGKLPDVLPGQKFWTDPDYVNGLIAAGRATLAPAGTTPPRPLPYIVRGVPGLGAGTSNSSP